jgi:hypothetical protein
MCARPDNSCLQVSSTRSEQLADALSGMRSLGEPLIYQDAVALGAAEGEPPGDASIWGWRVEDSV